MYLIRRIYRTKPGEARKVATMGYKACILLEEAGQRRDSRVYFNPGTTPGEKNLVVLEWIDDSIQSVFRKENDFQKDALVLARGISALVEDTWIEFSELLTPDKMVELS